MESGAACTSNAPCGSDGYCQLSSAWPGGYCTGDCSANASICLGGECVSYTTGQFCMQSCPSIRGGQSTCRSGYVCDFWYDSTGGVASTGICDTNCATYPCATGYTCNAQGYCDPTPLGSGVPGTACTSDAQCTDADAFCATPFFPDGGGDGWPNGYCLADCDFAPAGACGPTGTCASFGTFALCQQACNSPGGGRSSCHLGYLCWPYDYVDGGLATNGICQPPCTDPGWGCGTGSTCRSSGYCQ
ncbi:MAG: hypothetical protein JST54_16880 [Deltaproteobacteria bacterium]|nr:hypothetical protein [Deltaproteobacteria bacterium]